MTLPRYDIVYTGSPPYQQCQIVVKYDDGEWVRADDAMARIAELEAQLPETMRHCTIQSLRCDVGHSRLTATNWIDHGCQYCAIAELEDENARLLAKVERYSDSLRDAHDTLGGDAEWVGKSGDLAFDVPALARKATACLAELEDENERMRAQRDKTLTHLERVLGLRTRPGVSAVEEWIAAHGFCSHALSWAKEARGDE